MDGKIFELHSEKMLMKHVINNLKKLSQKLLTHSAYPLTKLSALKKTWNNHRQIKYTSMVKFMVMLILIICN